MQCVCGNLFFFSLRAGVTCLLNQLERGFFLFYFIFFLVMFLFLNACVCKKKIQPDKNSLKDKSYFVYMFLNDCIFWLNFFFKLVLPVCA